MATCRRAPRRAPPKPAHRLADDREGKAHRPGDHGGEGGAARSATEADAALRDSLWSLDVALSRVFEIGRQRFELRAAAFNLPNAVVAMDPTAATLALSSRNFGRVTAAHAPPIMQFAVKYVF